MAISVPTAITAGVSSAVTATVTASVAATVAAAVSSAVAAAFSVAAFRVGRIRNGDRPNERGGTHQGDGNS